MDEDLTKFYLELKGLETYDKLLKKHIPIFITAEDFKLEKVKKTVPPKGQLVICTELRSIEITNYDGSKSTIPSAGIKLGDGNTTIEQLPFIDWFYCDHIKDPYIHITENERTSWNEKISCEVLDDETLNLF